MKTTFWIVLVILMVLFLNIAPAIVNDSSGLDSYDDAPTEVCPVDPDPDDVWC